MPSVISGFDIALQVLRVGFFAIAIVLAVVCTLDWLVRTRRLSPFGGMARFFRGSIDPLLAPVERRIVRAGGVPTSAPWWALAGAVLAGIIAISLLGFVRDQLYAVALASSAGARGIGRLFVSWIFALLQIALLVRVVVSWVRVSPYSKWVRWSFVLTEPILRPLRQVIPTIGMIDITPLIAYFLLSFLASFILRGL